MEWIPFALLTAFFESGKDVFGKIGVKSGDEYLLAWAWRFYALPFLLPLLLFVEFPAVDATFWYALAVSGFLNVLSSVLYMRAIMVSELSLTVPMVTFTPLFLLITSPLLLGECPGGYATMGIFLIVLGSYLLQFDPHRKCLLAPFKALLKEKGPRLMLFVAFLWSITANVDKIGLQHSSPVFWSIAVSSLIALSLLPFVLVKNGGKGLHPRTHLVGIGACGGLTVLCQMMAISMTLVPYVIAVKRTSTILSVIWGGVIFKEKHIRKRLAGTIVMLLGLALIVLGD